MTKLQPTTEMEPTRLLALARGQLARLRGQNMGAILGPHPRGPRTDDPNNPPPDPAKVQELSNLWKIVELKSVQAEFRGAKTVPLTPSEALAAGRALGIRR